MFKFIKETECEKLFLIAGLVVIVVVTICATISDVAQSAAKVRAAEAKSAAEVKAAEAQKDK